MNPQVKGAVWMLGMVGSLSLLAVAARELAPRHDPMELQVMRHGISMLILLPLVMRMGFRSVRSGNIKLQVFRNVSHFGATVGWYAAVTMLPLAEVFAIEFTTPVWTALLAVLFLGEKLRQGRIIALLFGIIGILIILRPGVTSVGLGEVIMIGAALGFAVANASTKALTRTDSVIAVLFWMSVIQGPMAAIPAAFSWTPIIFEELHWVIIVGVTGLGAHFSMTNALKLADASLVMPVDFLRLPLIAVVGFMVYNESIDILVLVGAAIIFAGNYYSIRREARSS
jgi:drug/metabolite transporter (DMT)-like permease